MVETDRRKVEVEHRYSRAYQEYKDSGVAWLGPIPQHWILVPVRSLAKAGYRTFCLFRCLSS